MGDQGGRKRCHRDQGVGPGGWTRGDGGTRGVSGDTRGTGERVRREYQDQGRRGVPGWGYQTGVGLYHGWWGGYYARGRGEPGGGGCLATGGGGGWGAGNYVRGMPGGGVCLYQRGWRGVGGGSELRPGDYRYHRQRPRAPHGTRGGWRQPQNIGLRP